MESKAKNKKTKKRKQKNKNNNNQYNYNQNYYQNYDYYNNDYYYDNYYDYDYYDYNTQYEEVEDKSLIFGNGESFTQSIDKQIDPYPEKKITDKKINILMIAEKPTIAKTITEILSNNNYKDNSYKEGWCIYEFNSHFKKIPAHFTISSVAGHIYRQDFLNEHRNWENIDPYDLYKVKTIKKYNYEQYSIDMIEWLQYLAKKQDILCLWLDCDSEGENISYEIIYNVYPLMNKKNYQQIYRAIFYSLTKEDIKNAFQNISNYPDNNLSASVDARNIIDLKVGVSFTRFLTQNILPCLKNVSENCQLLSYGPCQTPTLWFCVNRQREVENKKLDKSFYKVFLEIKVNDNVYKVYLKKEFDNKNEAENLVKKLKKFKEFEVSDLSTEIVTKNPPAGLNTADMLKMSSTQLKFSPQKTMKIAENLYLGGKISYPRTETTEYPETFDFESKLHSFSKHPEFGEGAQNIINEFNNTIISNGINAFDHPPITPSKILKREQFKKNAEDEWKLYEQICLHYLASLSPCLVYEKTKYIFKFDNEEFEANCNIIKNEGFLFFEPFYQKDYIKSKDALILKNFYEIKNIEFEEIKKDDYITEAELIEEMEKNHIGTDASMSDHISNICRRGYVDVDQNRHLKPTKLGKALIEALESIDKEIVLPQIRAKIEKCVEQISIGEKNYKDVMDNSLNIYRQKFARVYENTDKLLKIFGKYFHVDDGGYY